MDARGKGERRSGTEGIFAKRVAKDKAFLTYICDSAIETCSHSNNEATTSASSVSHSFYVVLMIESPIG